ncbi:MAG: hypothetical protein AAGF89_01895 [Bacteroidota bacterium]
MQQAIDLLSPDAVDAIINSFGSLADWFGQTCGIVVDDHIF